MYEKKNKIKPLSRRALERHALALVVKLEQARETMRVVIAIQKNADTDTWSESDRERYYSASTEEYQIREDMRLIAASSKLLDKLSKG